MAKKRKILFSAIQCDDGTIQMDWHPEIYPWVDENGKDTDYVIDFAEELLSRRDDSEADE